MQHNYSLAAGSSFGMKVARSLLLLAATYGLSAGAQTTYDGQFTRNIAITYQVGDSNSVVGQITNNADRPVDVIAEFKGYAADGSVSQGGGIATVSHLDPGESARFKSGGFFEMITTARLITLRTVP